MVEAWHFLPEDKKMRYEDGREVEVGETYTCDPKRIKLCHFGFHGSEKARDALGYAPGPIICRVQLSGKIIKSDDKIVASGRKVIWMADATRTLHEFACWAAEQVLHIFEKERPKDDRPRKAIQAKRDWLQGKISDKELAATWDAARAAARDAAWAATWDAARAAAWDAARAATWDAAWDATWDAQEKRLTQMLMELKND